MRSLGLFDSTDPGSERVEAREARRDPLVFYELFLADYCTVRLEIEDNI